MHRRPLEHVIVLAGVDHYAVGECHRRRGRVPNNPSVLCDIPPQPDRQMVPAAQPGALEPASAAPRVSTITTIKPLPAATAVGQALIGGDDVMD
jgi:hypothetical protein